MDPLLAFAALKSAHGSIMSAIKIGKDISSLSAAAAKYGKAEAALQSHSEAKKKGLLAKLGVLESNAIDNYFKKAEQDELRDELRSAFLLYAKPGAWEGLQSEIASMRAAKAKEYKAELLRKKKIRDLCLAFGICVLFAIALAMFGFVFVKSTEVAIYTIL